MIFVWLIGTSTSLEITVAIHVTLPAKILVAVELPNALPVQPAIQAIATYAQMLNAPIVVITTVVPNVTREVILRELLPACVILIMTVIVTM
jgi:hypothetical protein